MEQVCISSDVISTHVTVDLDLLENIKGLKLEMLSTGAAILLIMHEDLRSLLEELKLIIASLTSKRRNAEFENAEVTFEGKIYKLDLRNDADFYLNVLIDIYDLVFNTMRIGGIINLFNKSVLGRFDGDSIVAFLRKKNGLSKIGLQEGLNGLWTILKLDKKMTEDKLTAGLHNLQYHGLLYFNEKDLEYNLTARGFLYW